LISFISHSVLTGFTSAAALLIGASQLGGVLGVETERGGGVLERVHRMWLVTDDINPIAITIAMITLVALLVTLRANRRMPAYFIALTVGSIVSILLSAPEHGVARFEPLSSVQPSCQAPPRSPLSDCLKQFPWAKPSPCVEAMTTVQIKK
jgi:SulP family sulfate permease